MSIHRQQDGNIVLMYGVCFFSFYRGGCLPAVCWRHVESGAVLLRSSAALFRRYDLYESTYHMSMTLNAMWTDKRREKGISSNKK